MRFTIDNMITSRALALAAGIAVSPADAPRSTP